MRYSSIDTKGARALLDTARGALERALAPHSGFRVGAALQASDGTVYTGCNIENPSLMLTICAERVALYKALSEGASDFTAIAVVSSAPSTSSPCMPCGTCRQLLYEFAPGLDVVVEGKDGEPAQFKIKELLPHAFEL